MSPRPPRLAITTGDPRGIGPEVLGEALPSFLDSPEGADFEAIVLGAAKSLGPPEDPRISPVSVGDFDGTSPSAGRISLDAIVRAVDLVSTGEADAIVTGPVHKPSLHAAGHPVPGQTEFLQELTGAATVGMLMHAEGTRVGDAPLRILLATTHLPLREVADRVTAGLLLDQIRLLDEALKGGWRIPAPRIGLCGLNPHASDVGLFGDEEATVMEPVVRELQAEGREVVGPLPADTIFLQAVDGKLDAVVSPYHDVGMAVFKTLAFGRGVNTTLGLPFPRTSPDHGTAFDLAGKGLADAGSTLEALRLAARLARPRL